MFGKIIRPMRPMERGVVRFANEYIIDIETTGLDPENDLIICLGVADLWALKATIYFLDDPSKWREFQGFCRKRVRELLSRGKVWAYNCKFEAKFLQVPIRVNGYGLKELLCGEIWLKLKDAAWHVALRYELKANRCIEDDDIDGKDVPLLYLRDWCIYKDERAKYLIIDHNYRDLVRAYLVRYHIYRLSKKLLEEVSKCVAKPVIIKSILNSFQ